MFVARIIKYKGRTENTFINLQQSDYENEQQINTNNTLYVSKTQYAANQ